MSDNSSQSRIGQFGFQFSGQNVPNADTISGHRDRNASVSWQANGIDLQFMPVNVMNLFKYVINVPNFDRSVNRWRNYGIPVPNGQRLDINDSGEMSIKTFDELK